MYTEKSITLKSDFYSRFGEGAGVVTFERTSTPCSILDGGDSFLAFGLGCGVRAYGRAYGDILKIMDSNSNVCDISFLKGGRGAEILYMADMPGIKGTEEHIIYTVNKLLKRMGRDSYRDCKDDMCQVVDKFAPQGWCAWCVDGEVRSMPFPLGEYNVILIRTRKCRIASDIDLLTQFRRGESERIALLGKSLKECRLEPFFEAVKVSEASVERLLLPSKELLAAVRAAENANGVMASRICDMGVVAFCKKALTDNAVHTIINECGRELGYTVNVSDAK